MKKLLVLALFLTAIANRAAVEATWCCNGYPEKFEPMTCENLQILYRTLYGNSCDEKDSTFESSAGCKELKAKIDQCQAGNTIYKTVWSNSPTCGQYKPNPDGSNLDCNTASNGRQTYRTVHKSDECPAAIKNLGNNSYEIDYCKGEILPY